MNFDLVEISKTLQSLILLTVPVLIGYLVVLVHNKIVEVRSHIQETDRFAFDALLSTLIYAAEQLYKSGEGVQKKNYVIDLAEKWLKDKGLSLDLQMIEAEIEARVRQNFPKI